MIELMQNSGFCRGVRRAYERALALAPDVAAGRRVYLYGHIANNREVMRRLEAMGFLVAEGAAGIEPGSVAVIRSHGVPESVYGELERIGAEIVDCTCEVVKSIHRTVRERSLSGDAVLIVGKAGHPEVEGIRGWCAGGQAALIGSPGDIEKLAASGGITVVGQTTCDAKWWEEAAALISRRFPHAKIENTLCGVVDDRCRRAACMAAGADSMFVVGDESSANSMKLVAACKAGCADARLLRSVDDAAGCMDALGKGKKIGLVGSASAPDDLLLEIHCQLRFMEFLARAKAAVDSEAGALFDRLDGEAACSPFVRGALEDLRRQHAGGKAIRAAMVALGELAAGAREPASLPLQLAFELFQTAILIHDDIIDKSPARRGKPTIHSGPGNPHRALSRAICIGDLGLFLAEKVAAEADIPNQIACLRLMAQIKRTTLHGEIMDVCLPYEPSASASEIRGRFGEYRAAVEAIYESKTAWYTLAGPLMLGATCGGADKGTLAALRDFALPLGVAFQLKDDILGIYSPSAALGKPNISDIAEKKQTLMYGIAMRNADGRELSALEACYGNPEAGERELDAVRRVFESTGARKETEDEMERLTQKSREAIARLNPETAPLFAGLATYLLGRKA